MRSLLYALSPQKPASRRLGKAASLLGLSAAAHFIVLIATDGDWSGAVSFRKPITFGISVSLLLWTCGWVMDRLPSRKRLEGVLAAVLIGSGMAEVALITVQAWRGVASHFNFATTTDSLIFAAMGATIGVFSLALLVMTGWAFVQRPAHRTTRVAVLAGLALVITGLGLGQWVITLGVEMAEQLGRAPETVLAGEAGVAKFPHAMALHGIQLFIGASVLAGLGRLDSGRQTTAVRMTVAGYFALVAWSIIHTNAGRAPFDLAGAETFLGVAGAALLAYAAIVIIGGLRPAALTETAAAAGPETIPAQGAAVTLTS